MDGALGSHLFAQVILVLLLLSLLQVSLQHGGVKNNTELSENNTELSEYYWTSGKLENCAMRSRFLIRQLFKDKVADIQHLRVIILITTILAASNGRIYQNPGVRLYFL